MTLQAEFTDKYPYLILGIFPSAVKKNNYHPKQVSRLSNLSEVIKKNSGEKISISADTTLSELCSEFHSKFGMHVLVGSFWVDEATINENWCWLDVMGQSKLGELNKSHAQKDFNKSKAKGTFKVGYLKDIARIS